VTKQKKLAKNVVVNHVNANYANQTKKNKNKMKKITKETKLSELLSLNPKAGEILFEIGMSCIGCPMAMQETIEQGCLAHGMNKKEIDEVLKKLNK